MDEQKTQPEDGSSDEIKTSHWSHLAEALGANPKQTESVSTPTASTPATPPPVTKKQDRKPKVAAKTSSRSNWKALASMLGIRTANNEPDESKNVADETQPTAELPAPDEIKPAQSVESTPTPVVKEFSQRRRRERGSRRETTKETRDEPRDEPSVSQTPPISAQPDLVAGLGTEFNDDETDIHRAAAENVLASMFKPSEIPYWEEEIEDEQDDMRQSADDDDVDAVRFERQDEMDDVDNEKGSGERPKPRDDERPSRGRRGRSRRGRRRGGRSREDVSEDVVDNPRNDEIRSSPSDSTLRLEASAELFDDTDDDDDDDDNDLNYESDFDADDEQGKRPGKPVDRQRDKRRVTSWDEAIGVIVERNLKNRSNSGGGGSSRSSRGRRR